MSPEDLGLCTAGMCPAPAPAPAPPPPRSSATNQSLADCICTREFAPVCCGARFYPNLCEARCYVQDVGQCSAAPGPERRCPGRPRLEEEPELATLLSVGNTTIGNETSGGQEHAGIAQGPHGTILHD